jgi:hypothetical protein
MVIGDFEAQHGSALKKAKNRMKFHDVEKEIVQSRQQQELIRPSAIDADVGGAGADAVILPLGLGGIDDVTNGGEEERAVTVPLKKRRKKQHAMEAVTSMLEEAVSVSVSLMAESDVAEVKKTTMKKKREKKEMEKGKEKGKEKTRKIAVEMVDESGQQVCKKKRKTPLLNHGPVEKEVEKDVIYWDSAARGKNCLIPDDFEGRTFSLSFSIYLCAYICLSETHKHTRVQMVCTVCRFHLTISLKLADSFHTSFTIIEDNVMSSVTALPPRFETDSFIEDNGTACYSLKTVYYPNSLTTLPPYLLFCLTVISFAQMVLVQCCAPHIVPPAFPPSLLPSLSLSPCYPSSLLVCL